MDLKPSMIETYPVDSGMVIWFLGGPSQAIRTKDALLYLDLFTGPSPVPEVTKAIPEVIDPALISRVDVAISTHHDEDHCDHHSLSILHDQTDSLFLGPVSCNRLYHKWGFDLPRMRQIAAYENFGLKDITLHAYPSRDAFDPDAVTYVLDTGNVKVFDSGDTLYLPELIEIGRQWELDAAMLSYAKNPSGKDYYMDEDSIMKAAKALHPKMVILKHFDLWQEFAIDPSPLVSRLRDEGFNARVFNLGEKIEITGEK